MSDPTTQMLSPDLDTQYTRIVNSPAFGQIEHVVQVYFGDTVTDKVTQGELDIIPFNEDVEQMITLNSIADVTAYLNSHCYQAQVLTQTPQLYARLGDAVGSTQALDSSGNNNNGTLAGGVTPGQPGSILNDPDTAMILNGTSGKISFPTINMGGWSAFSFLINIKPTTIASGYPRILSSGYTSSNNTGIDFELSLTTGYGYLNLGLGSSNQGVGFNYTWVAGSWFRLAATWDGVTLTVYVNGSPMTSAAISGLLAGSSSSLTIGCNPGYNGDFFGGTVDEFALCNYCLTAAQIAQLNTVATSTY